MILKLFFIEKTVETFKKLMKNPYFDYKQSYALIRCCKGMDIALLSLQANRTKLYKEYIKVNEETKENYVPEDKMNEFKAKLTELMGADVELYDFYLTDEVIEQLKIHDSSLTPLDIQILQVLHKDEKEEVTNK